MIIGLQGCTHKNTEAPLQCRPRFYCDFSVKKSSALSWRNIFPFALNLLITQGGSAAVFCLTIRKSVLYGSFCKALDDKHQRNNAQKREKRSREHTGFHADLLCRKGKCRAKL